MNALRKEAYDVLASGLRPVVVPTGQEVMWQALRKVGANKAFSCRDIARSLGCRVEPVENYVLALRRAEIAVEVGRGPNAERLYQLTGRPNLMHGINSRGEKDATYALCDAVWRAARMLRLFTLSELLTHFGASTSKDAVRHYVASLEDAGYLIGLESLRECGEKQFRFVPSMNSGPLPPQPLRATFLFDRNRQSVANRELVAVEVRL